MPLNKPQRATDRYQIGAYRAQMPGDGYSVTSFSRSSRQHAPGRYDEYLRDNRAPDEQVPLRGLPQPHPERQYREDYRMHSFDFPDQLRLPGFAQELQYPAPRPREHLPEALPHDYYDPSQCPPSEDLRQLPYAKRRHYDYYRMESRMSPSNEGHGSDLRGIPQPVRTKRRRQDQDHEDLHPSGPGPEYPLPRVIEGRPEHTSPHENERGHEDRLKEQDANADPGDLTESPDRSQDVLDKTVSNEEDNAEDVPEALVMVPKQ
ncbi:MAG: hypothetical protein J3Q66DRAFT_363330 [Benniella sp.]|nr:MAG: hypothetical protein J3Q66DRAFT_363330 [Benniella sp.]